MCEMMSTVVNTVTVHNFEVISDKFQVVSIYQQLSTIGNVIKYVLARKLVVAMMILSALR
jgi:hypothetical protein